MNAAGSDDSMRVILITGMSGSGKSVALRALEDLGYYCVDNLPPELFQPLVALERQQNTSRIAVAMDVRSANSLPLIPAQFATLREQGVTVDSIFLDTDTDTLVRRFSETRRSHPLAQAANESTGLTHWRMLLDAIEHEREILETLRAQSHIVDTSVIRASQLQSYVKAFVGSQAKQLTLVFESFAYKRGIPLDADFVFDVRMLPNPYYEPGLSTLTGMDTKVVNFIQAEPTVTAMRTHILEFLANWLPALADNHRSYVTVAIGCTGGQHRSVYLVEQLAAHFTQNWTTLKRHRELDARQAS
jgi:UPF0042 nucleotide-binding protein